jgi:hypothetical protein
MAIVDVKLALRRRDAEGYSVELSSTQPDSDAEIVSEQPGVAQLDRGALQQLEADPLAYGQALSQALFASPHILADFSAARAAADAAEASLRLRLQIDANAPELHGLRWETLRDPAGDRPLILGQRVRFSRYLASADWRRVQLRPRSALRALVAVAAPAGLEKFGLAAIDAAAEVERARAALADLPVAALAERGTVTLDGIAAALRDGHDGQEQFDILYLVAHGAIVEGEPWLFLEGEDGAIERARGTELAQRISELAVGPRLVVLASCESAGSGGITADSAPLAALGPRLARAGVPAVIAMQGKVSLTTAADFTSAFFRQLQKDGQIDAAVAVARGEVRDAPDAWMPVLFMRLRSGQIWYEPGFKGERPMEKWPALITRLNDGQCTPILGEQLSELVLGTPQELARRWAREYNFPLAPHQQGELPYVAQYLSVHQDTEFPRDGLVRATRQAILERYKPDLPPPLATPRAPLAKLFPEVARIRREKGLADPYAALAQLPCAVFVTVATDLLLEEALKAAGKAPRTELCRWNDDLVANIPSAFDDESYEPDEFNPLVFHLFGVVTETASLVLTEDDYFDFLIGATRNRDLVPQPVKTALADSALLFLGFRMEDWSFRVLYRGLMNAQGGKRLKRYANVAGQVLPEESQFLAPQGAARYLESYFQGANISIFWGSVGDFSQELSRRWRESQGEEPEESPLQRAVGAR